MTNDDFLAGGESLPAFRFADVGDTVSGQVLGVKKLEDRTPDGTAKTWPNGDPMHVWVFDLDTTGDRRADTALWVRGNMVKALKQSMVEAGLKPSDQPKITVKHHDVGEPRSKGYAPPKLFKAKCEPGPKAAVVSDDDF